MDEHKTSCATGADPAVASCQMPIPEGSTYAIQVTVNPEARVSAVRANDLRRWTDESGTLRLPVLIHNQANVTMTLVAFLIAPTPETVTMNFGPHRLDGSGQQSHTLAIVHRSKDPVDVTLGFQLEHLSPDLGGRNIIHFVTGLPELVGADEVADLLL